MCVYVCVCVCVCVCMYGDQGHSDVLPDVCRAHRGSCLRIWIVGLVGCLTSGVILHGNTVMAALRLAARRSLARVIRSGAKSKEPASILKEVELVQPTRPILTPTVTSEHTLYSDSGIANLLDHPSLIISRRVEFLNIALGFEQKHQYGIYSPDGEVSGVLVLALVCSLFVRVLERGQQRSQVLEKDKKRNSDDADQFFPVFRSCVRDFPPMPHE
jgi:hypothetical protein